MTFVLLQSSYLADHQSAYTQVHPQTVIPILPAHDQEVFLGNAVLARDETLSRRGFCLLEIYRKLHQPRRLQVVVPVTALSGTNVLHVALQIEQSNGNTPK